MRWGGCRGAQAAPRWCCPERSERVGSSRRSERGVPAPAAGWTAPGDDSSAARCPTILSPRRPKNFWISFAAAAVLSSEPGAAGGGRGAERGVVRGRSPRETPPVPGCCRPLRHAAGRCGADAPLLMPSGAGRGGSVDKVPSLQPSFPFTAPLLRSSSPPPPAPRAPATVLSYRGLSLPSEVFRTIRAAGV